MMPSRKRDRTRAVSAIDSPRPSWMSWVLQKQGMAAELEHADFKRDAGPGRGFGEDHAQGLAGQQRMGDAGFGLGFELVGQIEQLEEFIGGQVVDADQVFHAAVDLLEDVLQDGDKRSDLGFSAESAAAAGGGPNRRPNRPGSPCPAAGLDCGGAWAGAARCRSSGRCRGLRGSAAALAASCAGLPAAARRGRGSFGSVRPASYSSRTARAAAQASGLPPNVLPWSPGAKPDGCFLIGDDGADRHAAGQPFGQRHDIRLDAVKLAGQEMPGPAHAGLDLVDDQAGAGLAAELLQPAWHKPESAGRMPLSPWISSRSTAQVSSVDRGPQGIRHR